MASIFLGVKKKGSQFQIFPNFAPELKVPVRNSENDKKVGVPVEVLRKSDT